MLDERIAALGNHVKVIGSYKGITKKTTFQCNDCGNIWESTPENVLNTGKCPKCNRNKNGKALTKSNEKFVEEIKSINPNIEILESYKGSHIKIKCKCKIHDEIFFSDPTHMLSGKFGCKKCRSQKISNALIKSNEQFLVDLKNIGSDITPLEKYKGAHTKILVECNKCGNEWSTEAGVLLSGYGCPRCNKSHGEKRVEKYLIDNNIDYIPQAKFDGLRGVSKRPLSLSYDFYLPSYNTLIEYQGQFHDHSTNIQTEEAYKVQLINDSIKKKYAEDHKYNLLEIWYNDFNSIEYIINNYINNLKYPVTTTVA